MLSLCILSDTGQSYSYTVTPVVLDNETQIFWDGREF